MAELIAKDGTWTFDGEVIRIVPGRERGVHKLRQVIGELTVPLAAVAGVAHEPGRKGGRLRLRLRGGADPLTQAARGQLSDAADPYQVAVEDDRQGVAEYFVEEVRNALLIEQIPNGLCDEWFLPGPQVPLTAAAGDGTATFDGERIRLEWNWRAEDIKKQAGSRQFDLTDVAGVEWIPCIGLENGYLRFRLSGAPPTGLAPKHDPLCLTWGIRREGGTTVLLAAAVLARLPHPAAPAPTPAVTGGTDLLRDLRELGDLHRDGVLTDAEFAAAKQLLLHKHQRR